MKKMILLIALLLLGGSVMAQTPREYYNEWKTTYAVQGPNHSDFLILIADIPALTESLYNIPTKNYYGPRTLASLNLMYDLFMSGYNSR